MNDSARQQERQQQDADRAAPKRPEMQHAPDGADCAASSNVQGSALMVVIAIMSFLACLTLGGVSMVRATAASWQSQISREITIQIKPDDGLDMDKALDEGAQYRADLRRHDRRPDHGQAGNRTAARALARHRPQH